MTTNTALFWAAVVAGCVIGPWLIWDHVRTSLRRRSRSLHFRQMAFTESMQLHKRPADLPGIASERAEFIRRDAENAARMAFVPPGHSPGNPYPEGTPEFVLWTASYHLVHTEMCEATDATGQGTPSQASEIQVPERRDPA